MGLETVLKDTGERMVPDFHKGKLLYAEHLIRYACARDLVRGKVVLDIASGSGYGSALLAETAAQVHGMDASAEAVAYANEQFGAPNIEFAVADAVNIPLPDHSIDVVITFETIEHIDDYAKFVSEIRRILKPGGLAIISTPNDLEFAEGNHFHRHEFEKDELLDLIGQHFPVVEEYYQATWKYVALDRLSALQGPELAVRTLNTSPLDQPESLYFYFLCSDRAITETIEPLAALGEHYSDRAAFQEHVARANEIGGLRAELEAIKASRRYQFAERLGTIRAQLSFWSKAE